MNASDRAPWGLFSIPEQPGQHFKKVEQAYNLWAQCWAISFVPIILDRQKWRYEDPCLSVNDIVYFKITESPMKAEWRIGKVDSVKLSRDNKAREVTIAYKIMKEGNNNWSHSIVTRPVREVIKLFEINDSTFAEEMKAAHVAAKDILKKRGAIEQVPQSNDGQEGATLADQTIVDKIDDSETTTGTHNSKFYKSKHHPFITCLTADEWFQQGPAGQDDEGDEVIGGEEKATDSGMNEILFLL